MEALFLRFFNMGLTGSAVILAVCLARLALRRAPKAMACALWAVVLFRLLCPVSFSSGFSALGLVGAPVRELRGAASAVEFVAPREEVLSPAPAPVSDIQAAEAPAAAVTEPARGPDITALLTGLWAAGALGMAAWGLWDYLRLRRRLVGAAGQEKGVYVSDYIDSAFVLGPFRPRIYLPSALEGEERGFVLLHERQHARRRDALWRLLGYTALCLHWYNPLVWLAFELSGRDMEMSCDEAVLQRLGDGVRADYSACLLRMASGRGLSPAFAGGDTKGRIKNLGRWKKPRLWAVIAAAAACVLAAACLLTNPGAQDKTPETDPALDAAIIKAVEEGSFEYAQDGEHLIRAAYEPFCVEELDNGGYTVWAALAAVRLPIDGEGRVCGAPEYTYHCAELSFRPDGNGGLRLTGYWRPEGENFTEAIAERFPDEALVRYYNAMGVENIYTLAARCVERALEETGTEADPLLEALFAQLEAGQDEDARVEDIIAGTQENYENYRLYGGILSFGESALDYCGRELRGAQGLHARLLGQAKADLESIAQFEARRLADPLDTGIKLRLERVEDRLVVETLEITEPAQQVRFLLHGLGIENRDPAFRGSAEMEDGIVVYESREGPSGGYEYVRSFSLVGGECLAVIEGEEGIVSGTAPRETYDFVASYFEG